MTIPEAVRLYVDREVMVRMDGFKRPSRPLRDGGEMRVLCRGEEIRAAFGGLSLKVQPVCGDGHLWVGLDRVELVYVGAKKASETRAEKV